MAECAATSAKDDAQLQEIAQKDTELRQLKEKYENCAKALIMAERHSAYYLKLYLEKQLNEPSEQNLGKPHTDTKPSSENGKARFRGEACESDGEVLVARSCAVTDNVATVKEPGKICSTLVPDDANIVKPEVVIRNQGKTWGTLETDDAVPFDMTHRLISQGIATTDVSKPNTCESLHGHLSMDGIGILPEMEEPVLTATQELLADRKDDNVDGVANAVGGFSFEPPGVSSDLLQKVIEQNTRLRKVLQKIVEQKGISVKDMLEKGDYIEMVDQLKQEIALLQTRVAEQEKLLNASGDTLKSEHTTLLDKVHKLEHSLTVKQAILDTLLTECNRLQKEVKQLRSGAAVQPVAAQAPGAVTAEPPNVQKEFAEFLELRNKYAEMVKAYQEKSSKMQTVDELQTRNKELEEKCQKLNEQRVSLENTVYAAKLDKRQNTTPCCVEERKNLPWESGHLAQMDVVTDGESADAMVNDRGDCDEKRSASLRSDLASVSGVDSTEQCPSSQQPLECKRCELAFSSQDAYNKHCMKCTDD